jgi:hypothetical protein
VFLSVRCSVLEPISVKVDEGSYQASVQKRTSAVPLASHKQVLELQHAPMARCAVLVVSYDSLGLSTFLHFRSTSQELALDICNRVTGGNFQLVFVRMADALTPASRNPGGRNAWRRMYRSVAHPLASPGNAE